MTDKPLDAAALLEGTTPGPWEVYACPINGGQQAKDELAFQVDSTAEIGPSLYLINAGGKCPATTGCGPTSEANARLIAAAPDLARKVIALEAIIAKYASHDDDCDSALNAGACTCGFDAALGRKEGGK